MKDYLNTVEEIIKLARSYDTVAVNIGVDEEQDDIMEYVDDIANKYDFKCVILDNYSDRNIIKCIKFTGDNRINGNIKHSLLEIYSIMDSLEKEENIEKVDIIDISIDNLDDVYAFAFMIVLK